MNRPLRMMGTLCLLLLAVLTGRAATVNAVWDFSDEFASFETIQGTTGTFTNNGVVLTVDATNGKFRANGNSAQMNEGTLLQVPVVSTGDEVSFVAYAANYSHFTVGGEDFDGQADGSHKATAAEVKAGYVLIASTNNNSYIKSVAVTQHQPEPVLEEDLTAMWDFQHANPATLPDVHIERATGTVESTVAGVSMFVDATNGKLKGRASDAQFNANTILQIPVKSAKDIVEVTSYPGYGAGRLMVGGEEATGDVTTHKATTAEVKQGYVEVKGIQESYLYCVKVTFVSPLQEKALYETDFTDWPTINRKEAKGEEVTVTTNYSHETLTFTLTGVGSDPAGTNAKFADYTGYMISAKYPGEFADEEPYAITSPLASITKIAFTQCATGGNRGWVIAVKGDGDEDWVPVFNKSIATAGGETHTLDINRKNAQLKFYNFNQAQNSYMMDLKIYGKVDLSQAPSLASFSANGETYQAADVFKENADGNMEATIEISKAAEMIGESNPLTDITPETGEVGTVTYAASEADPTATVVTIPVEYNGETATYIVNCVWKPDFTVTYMDGEEAVGTQTVEKDAAIGEMAFGADDVNVAEGMKFRGWCFADGDGQKATEATVVTGDLTLTALVTDIEGDDNTERNTYDFRKRWFYPEDHEGLLIEGPCSYNGSQHGYDLKPDSRVKLYVTGKATIVVSNCQYGRGDINVLNPAGEQIGTISVPSSDGALSAVSYDGEAGWITLEMTAQSYLHYVTVINLGGIEPIEPVNGYYIAKAGDVSSLRNILDMVTVNAVNGERVKIFLPDGIYDMGETALTPIPASNISLIGQSMEKTLIVNAPKVKNEGIGTTATLLINGGTENTYFQDLTLQNALDYYSSGAAGRAVCLQDKGNRTIAKNMRMLSYQDTYYSNNNNMQAYWEDCDIHGTVDFICGGGDVLFKNTMLSLEPRNANGTGERTLTAATTTTDYGYVFDGCKIVDLAEGKGSWNFSRTWQNTPIVVFKNTTLDDNAAQTIIATRWTPKGMNNTEINIFGEYNTMNEAGENITPESNVVTGYNGSFETVLTAEQAAKYSYENMFSENAKAWDPASLTKQVAGPKATYANGVLTWTPVAEATAYAIFKNDVFEAIVDANTSSYEIALEATDVLSIRSANEMGGFGEATEVTLDNSELLLDENVVNELPESGTKVSKVKTVRTLRGGMWNTLCLPFDVTVDARAEESHPLHNATLLALKEGSYDAGANFEQLVFEEALGMMAGFPYLIKPEADIVNPEFNNVTIINRGDIMCSTGDGNAMMTGVVNPYTFDSAASDIFFLLPGNQFAYVSEPGTMKGMRGYLMLSDIEAADLSNMTVVFTDTDGIEYVSTPSAADDALYDLQGRKLNSVPQHGVYIKNGKKYVK